MSTLVTGATGLLGNNMVRRLLSRGDEVRVLSREGSDPRPLEGLDVEILRGDICDAESVKRAFRGVHYVIHCAGRVHIGWSGAKKSQQTNVKGTRNVAEAAFHSNARMVHISSVSALGIGKIDQLCDEDSPRTGHVPLPYMLTKRQSEEVVQEYIAQGLDAVIVNPGLMIGPWDWKPSSGKMIRELAGWVPPLGPRGGCSVCDPRDVAAGALTAMERGQVGRNYILAGRNISYVNLWRIIANTMGRRGPWRRMGPLAPVVTGVVGDIVGWFRKAEPEFNSGALRTSQQFHYYSSARAEEELGYRTRPIEESIQTAWEWFCQHGYVTR